MALFVRFARVCSSALGHPLAFCAAVFIVLLWAATGPVFHYSDTWQLVINTGTTVITFLVVFLIQNMQNRETKVVQLKLDELIRALKSADNSILGIEEMTEQELELLQNRYIRLARATGKRLHPGEKQGAALAE